MQPLLLKWLQKSYVGAEKLECRQFDVSILMSGIS